MEWTTGIVEYWNFVKCNANTMGTSCTTQLNSILYLLLFVTLINYKQLAVILQYNKKGKL